jgi:protein-arginine kinase activator protein McsA
LALLCEQCCLQPALLRLRMGGAPASSLCETCLRTALSATRSPRLDICRFFSNLARLDKIPPPLDLDAIPDDRCCAQCGLTYAQLRMRGLLGCEGCYSAFSAVIEPALLLLSGAAAGPR